MHDVYVMEPDNLSRMFNSYSLMFHGYLLEGQVKDPETGTWYAVFRVRSGVDAGVYRRELYDADAMAEVIRNLESEDLLKEESSDPFIERARTGAERLREIFAAALADLKDVVQTNTPFAEPSPSLRVSLSALRQENRLARQEREQALREDIKRADQKITKLTEGYLGQWWKWFKLG